MRKYLLNILGAVFFFLIVLPVISGPRLVTHATSEAIDVLGTDTQKAHRHLHFEHKKMNARLDQVINEKLKALQNSQEVVLRQVEKISKLEAAGEKLRAGLIAQFGKLKGALAEDIETLSQNNERYLLDFPRDNNDGLIKMKEALDTQNMALNGTQAFFRTFFKDEFIPALIYENDTSRKALQAEMVRANTEQKNSLQTHQQTVVASLNQVVTSLMQMDEANLDRLVKMKKALEDQNKALTKTQDFFQTFFKGELIPALEKQNDANRKDIQAEIKALRAEMHGSLVSFKDFFRDELIPFFEKQYEADRQALREEVTQTNTEPEGQSDVNRETSSGNLGTDVQNETNSEFMERMLK